MATMYRLLGVSLSGYYAWRQRPVSKRKQEDVLLCERIRTIHIASRGTYGSPRVHAELKAMGVDVGRKRVARLMSEAGLEGVSRRRRRSITRRDPDAQPAPDLVQRDFTANRPDELWVADIKYIATWAGFLYLAIVMDTFSRRVVGWAMASHLRAELVLAALNMAIWQRRPERVIHHSDRGGQYTSIAFGKRCRTTGVRPSMGATGEPYDNAMCESFFATLECELLERRTFRNRDEAERAVFEFIEGWYNPHRRHSALRYDSPLSYEQRHSNLMNVVSQESGSTAVTTMTAVMEGKLKR